MGIDADAGRGRDHYSSGLGKHMLLTDHRPAKELRCEDKRSDKSAAAEAAGVAAGWIGRKHELGLGREGNEDEGEEEEDEGGEGCGSRWQRLHSQDFQIQIHSGSRDCTLAEGEKDRC